MCSHLSRRLPPHAQPNAITLRLEAMRVAGTAIIDLTESNPTQVGLHYPEGLLAPLSVAAAGTYAPEPLGLSSARIAVAADGSRRGVTVNPARVVLSASSSESYAWLFKLLCDPGDRVLVPRPSYPLFEHLARLEAVEVDTYALDYHGRWEVDLHSVERGITAATRVVIAVSPNNPTGSYLSASEADSLIALTARHGVALVVDEVFADYALERGAASVTDVACLAEGRSGALVATLGGLSKSAGLPQLKLGWMVLGGDTGRVAEALAGLELIADSYLSVSTPVQVGAPALLAAGASVRRQIQERTAANLATLRGVAGRHPACDVFPVEGGWSAVVRVPATRSEEQLVLHLLEQEHVLVHPGYFFDFPSEAYLVVSLLPNPAVFGDAVERVLSTAAPAVP